MTDAQVIKLTGKAWAVSPSGARRELKVGDKVAADEMVITDAGVQITLDLGALGEIILEGQQDSPQLQALLHELDAVEPLANTPQQPATQATVSNTRSSGIEKDGHNFVQLVRIAEIIEADGFTPLEVARIEELLRPLGMGYPDRSRVYEEEREYLQKPNHSTGSPDITATISINVIAGDDIINAAEAELESIPVSGSVGGNVKPGDTVTVVVNGKEYTTTVNPDGKTWEVDIPTKELLEDSSVKASVTTSSNGKTASADAERPYDVDDEKPKFTQIPDQDDKDADPIDLNLREHFTDNKTPVDELDIVVEGLPEGLTYDPNTGKITGDIDKSASQGGPNDDGKYPVKVTVTDKAGNTTETTFEWTVVNPDPIAKNDKQTIAEDTVAEGNVLTGRGNDDPNSGKDSDPDGDDIRVKDFTVEGIVYLPGETAVIPNVGKITINENGDYTFTPEQDWNGSVPPIDYTITDGEGGEDTAKLEIVVTPVNDAPRPVGKIEDKTNRDADSGDDSKLELNLRELFEDVDNGHSELTYTIEGLPLGLEFDPATGEITGEIDRSASQGGPNNDGKYEVTITATDPDGAKGEQTFTWTVHNPAPKPEDDEGETWKTLELNVTAADGVLENDQDEDPIKVQGVVAGKDGDQSTSGVGDDIGGEYGTLTLQEDGSYKYIPNLNNETVWTLSQGEVLKDYFTYTVTDEEGGVETATLEVTIKGHSANPPIIIAGDENGSNVDGHVTVYEKGLPDGTSPESDAHKAGGVIQISALDGLNVISIDGVELTKADLLALDSNNPIVLNIDGGKLVLTGFDPLVSNFVGVGVVVGGKLHYQYVLENNQSHENGLEKNGTTLEFDLVVKDDQFGNPNSAGTGKLEINIIDDVPQIQLNNVTPELEVDETTLASPKTADFSGLFTPHYGADGKDVADTYELLVTDGTDSGLVDTASGKLITLHTATDGSIEGRVDGDSSKVAFTLSVDAEGKITLTQNSSVKHPDATNPDDKITLKDADIKLQLTITDADGDPATESADIGKFIGFKDDGPTLQDGTVDVDGFVIGNAIVDEKHLPSGSEADTSLLTVTKELPINFGADGAVASDGKTGLVFTNTTALEAQGFTSGTKLLSYSISADGHTITATADGKPVFTITLDLDSAGKPQYTFELQGPLDHTLNADDNTKADNLVLPFEITATDGDGDSVPLKFKVEVVDDTPSADMRELEVNEDGSVDFSNADVSTSTVVIKDATKEPAQDANGNDVWKLNNGHGKVLVSDDGTMTYVPDEDYRGKDSFEYTVTTAGGSYDRAVDVTVKPVADAPLFENNEEGKDGYTVVTPEDVPKLLGLKLPVIKDVGGQGDASAADYEDYSELLGAITLTPSGAGYVDDAKLQTGTTELKPDADGKITIVITDKSGFHVSDIETLHPEDHDNGVYHLTQAEYEAITAHPAEDRHENFQVKVEVTSYEVGEDGKKLADVDGAKAEQIVTVDVQAVTDDVELKVKEGDTPQAGVEVVILNGGKTADLTFDEDTTFNLTEILAPKAFKDTDGSETRYLGFDGLPVGTVVTVDGTEYTIGDASVPTYELNGKQVPAIKMPGTQTDLPIVTIKPPKDFSGDLNGIKVILAAQDSDDDSSHTPALKDDEVTLNLYVKPVAGDIEIKGVEGNEDTAIAFLKKVKITDDSDVDNTLGEVITKVSFKLPAGWSTNDDGKTWTNMADQVWTVAEPTDEFAPAGGKYSVTYDANDGYVITFDPDSTLTREEREEILSKFTITPPAHSSKDIELDIKVTSKDFSAISGGDPSAEVTVGGSLKVTVKPVAESAVTDSDGANGNDVTINPSHAYDTKGEEDSFFELGVDGTFNLSTGWSNEDGTMVYDNAQSKWVENTTDGCSEDTFALLTPYETVGNDARPNATEAGVLEGSVFTYKDGSGNTIKLPFAGEPVKIPMQYLDSVEFKGPQNWSGVVKIKVQAGTVDYDEDDGTATDMVVSGGSWLTNLIVEPRADQVTLKVDAIVKTFEDEPVTLNIVPTSSDTNETFDVTISGIPKGASITYWDSEGEKTFTANTDDASLSITNFDKDPAKQPVLTPPKDSNEPINLAVKAESVDTLEYINSAGNKVIVEHKGTTVTTKVYDNAAGTGTPVTTTEAAGTDTSHQLPIRVEVQGVPDTPDVVIVQNKEYFEDGQELSGNQEAAAGLVVALEDLVTKIASGETGVDGTGPDGSEIVTLRISDLQPGFELVGAGAQLGAGEGVDRVWVISKEQLDSVKIIVPKHYSGTVKFTVQPVVTEDDNPSETYFDKQNVSFKVNPVAESTLSISSDLVEDTIGQLNLATVGADGDEYISEVRISDVPPGVILYADAAGTIPLVADSGVYTVQNVGTSGAPVVYVKGPANYSGQNDLKLKIDYTVTDPVGDRSFSVTAGSNTKTGTIEHTLNFAPVTDEIGLAIDGDQSTVVTSAGAITVKLKISQQGTQKPQDGLQNANLGVKEQDGSEKLTHILIEGVPAGVSVNGAVETAKGTWLITVNDKFFDADIMDYPITFNVSGKGAGFDATPIKITTYTQDQGAAGQSPADKYEKAEVTWTLKYDTQQGESNDLPVPVLTEKTFTGTEDTEFSLSKVVGGTIPDNAGTDVYNVTLTIRTSPDDETSFDGMTRTEVVENGKTVILWTKTEPVASGQNGQDVLDAMLNSIQVKTPDDANSNNLDGGKLKLDINLSVHADGISRDDRATPEVSITPVTDLIAITVGKNSVDEGQDIPLGIVLPGSTVDGSQGDTTKGWTIVDGKVYIHIADDGTGLKGELTGDSLTAVGSGPAGTPSGGKLYTIDADKVDSLKFIPNLSVPHQTGKLDVTVLVQHQESGASNTVVSTGTGSVEIHASNSGYRADITATGDELNEANPDLILLQFANAGLVDSEEQLDSAFISGLPDGFTVWIDGEMANNAGGGIWSIPLDGNQLPANISIKPPKNWSGTLQGWSESNTDGLKLTVMSGHGTLAPTASDIGFDLVVNPVADGLSGLNPTLSFGNAGEKIALNLNASMKDPSAATGAAGDQHTERTTLELTGFPDKGKVLFYVGDAQIAADRANYDEGSDTWTLTGLTQQELDSLQFMHGSTGGLKEVDVKAWTYEVDAVTGARDIYDSLEKTGKVEINIGDTVPTSGKDHFLWEDKAINGFGGEDTVQLRLGDNLGAGDFGKLSNIEIIDMSGVASGVNQITGLSMQDVLDMTDDRNLLKILGDEEDTIEIDLNIWGNGTAGTGDKEGYTIYTATEGDITATLEVQTIIIE